MSLRVSPPDGDVTEADRKKEQQDRLRRSALRSSVIQELREQYSDTPEEIRDRRDFQTERQSRDDQHRYGARRGHRPTRRRLPRRDEDMTLGSC